MRKIRSKKNKINIKIDNLINENISPVIFWHFIINTTWYNGFDNHEVIFNIISDNIKKQLRKQNRYGNH